MFKPIETDIEANYPLLTKKKLQCSILMLSSLVNKKQHYHCLQAWESLQSVVSPDFETAVAVFESKARILPDLVESRRMEGLARGLLMIKIAAKRQPNSSRLKPGQEPAPSATLSKLRDQCIPVPRRLATLREELRTLIDQEDMVEQRVEEARRRLRKAEEQESCNNRQCLDDTLEIMILNKEISKISLENMQLEKELDEANRDVRTLLKQVSELLSTSDSRVKEKKPSQGTGSFKKAYYYSTGQD